MPGRLLTLLLFAALLLAGCFTVPAPELGPAESATGEPIGTAVVGLVDSGINPYHERFQAPGAILPAWFVDARAGVPPIPVPLTSRGSFDQRFEADRAVWDSLKPETLYWFEGTRVLGYSMEAAGDEPLLLNTGHGNRVASALREVSQEPWVVMVQFKNSLRDPIGLLGAFEKAGRGAQWLADQPWVDIISLSIGFQGNPPLPMWATMAAATESAAHQGKLLVAAAGNHPVPTTMGGTNGPPWMIVVGGVEESTQGEQPTAAKLVDVVANFTRQAAAAEPDAYVPAWGTSYGSPVVAGNLAQALLELRRAEGITGPSAEGVLCPCLGRDLNNADFREALNRSAVYWDTLDYDPLNYSEDPVLTALLLTVPVLPTPWVQMGWGYVGDEAWRDVVAVLRDEDAPPGKPMLAREHMAAQQGAREAYWSTQ